VMSTPAHPMNPVPNAGIRPSTEMPVYHQALCDLPTLRRTIVSTGSSSPAASITSRRPCSANCGRTASW
jgi:hypothetical protein